MVSFQKSNELKSTGDELVAGFTQSMMKRPDQFSPGRFPVYLESGEGAVVRDVDGNTFVDFICGLAANTLGHRHPVIVEAIERAMTRGLIHSLPTPVELDAARAISSVIPGAEMVRFFKTGADANSAAVRLARYVTGREKLITVGYNGWHDHFMFDTPGVPKAAQELTQRCALMAPEDEGALLEILEQRGDEIAAIVLSLPYNRRVEASFLQQLREVCTRQGVIFVWDEIVTGFRLALGGAQEYFGVRADLVTLSKGIAGGMPLSALTGRRKLMKRVEELQVSTTFGGDLLSLEVCCAVVQEYQKSNYFEHLHRLGQAFRSEIEEAAASVGAPLRVLGYDPMPMLKFAPSLGEHVARATRFVGDMAERGFILRRDVNFICFAHTIEQVHDCAAAAKEVLAGMVRDNCFS